jgi:PAS domain S-box-containing protein
MTPEGVVLSANRSAAVLAGFRSEKELVGKNIYDLIPEGAAAFRRIRVSRVIGSGQPVQFEENISGCHLLSSVFPVRDEDGQISRLAVFAVDMTRRKRSEEARSESEEFIRSVIEELPVGIAVNFPSRGGENSLMKGDLPKLYLTTREALSRPGLFWEVAYEDPELRREPAESSEQGSADCQGGSGHGAGGSVFRKGEDSISLSGFRAGVQDRSLAISISRDSSRRISSECSLNRVYESRKAALDHNSVSISRLDAEGRYILVNSEICRMFGRPPLERAPGDWKPVFRCSMKPVGSFGRV